MPQVLSFFTFYIKKIETGFYPVLVRPTDSLCLDGFDRFTYWSTNILKPIVRFVPDSAGPTSRSGPVLKTLVLISKGDVRLRFMISLYKNNIPLIRISLTFLNITSSMDTWIRHVTGNRPCLDWLKKKIFFFNLVEGFKKTILRKLS